MQLSTFAIIASFVVLANSQSLAGLPSCALSCVNGNFGGCQTLDVKCICSNSNYISDLSCCIAGKCSPADQQTTIMFASQLCETVGVTVPQAASCSNGASSGALPASTGSSGPSGSSSVSGASTASGASAASTSPAASAASSATGTTASAASVTSSGTAVASASKAAAAHIFDSGLGAVGAAVAALALL